MSSIHLPLKHAKNWAKSQYDNIWVYNPYGSNESKQCCQPKIKTKSQCLSFLLLRDIYRVIWPLLWECQQQYTPAQPQCTVRHYTRFCIQGHPAMEETNHIVISSFYRKKKSFLILYLKGWFNGWSFQIATYLQVACSYVCNCQVLQICSKCKGLEVWVHRSRYHKLYIKMLNCTNGVYSNVAKVKCKTFYCCNLQYEKKIMPKFILNISFYPFCTRHKIKWINLKVIWSWHQMTLICHGHEISHVMSNL